MSTDQKSVIISRRCVVGWNNGKYQYCAVIEKLIYCKSKKRLMLGLRTSALATGKGLVRASPATYVRATLVPWLPLVTDAARAGLNV